MNQTVKRIVDILFQETVENDETRALHEELMNNCQEHYQDLIDRGLSEDEAVSEVVDSLKGMKDVIAQYPRKATASGTANTGDAPYSETRSFSGADVLKMKTSDQDILLSPSQDNRIHVYCDEPDGMTAEQQGNQVLVKGAEKHRKVASAFNMPEGEEISLSGILNMVGKAIRNVAETFQGGSPIRVEVPDGLMTEIEADSRSGDISCTCAMARKMAVRSTSGDIHLDPETEKTAESLLVSTVSGDAEVHGSAMDGEVSSMSGEVTVDGVFGTLRLKSTSGDVSFTGSVTELTAHSVSGDTEVTAENTSLKRIDGKSTSGDVEITLPAGLRSVHAECSSVSGDCLSRVSDAGRDATVQITAKSVSGDVTVQ